MGGALAATSKGRPLVIDPAADCAPPDRSTRRALLGAGAVGAALALAGSRPAAAQSSGGGLSADDSALVSAAVGVELAARDLYDEAIAAGADDQLWHVLREQHESYGQRLAGIAGISANARDDAVFDTLQASFQTSDPTQAAFELENAAAATHVELLRHVTHNTPSGAIASIVAMASRHAAVTGRLAGQPDDALFVNEASPLEVAT